MNEHGCNLRFYVFVIINTSSVDYKLHYEWRNHYLHFCNEITCSKMFSNHGFYYSNQISHGILVVESQQ